LDDQMDMTLSTAPAKPIFVADQVQIRKLFPTPLIVAPLTDAPALNAALSTIILDRAQHHSSVKLSNDGGWQSTDDFVTWGGEAGAILIHAATILATQMTMLQGADGPEPTRPSWKINAWANINRAGDANFLHSHPGAFWSGVYWVDDGGVAENSEVGGTFIANDPRGVLPNRYAPHLRYAVSDCLSAGLSEFVTPKSGDLILFPSFLVHAVNRFEGTRPRISVAFNFSL
jgi:uncharacterized protein (TIGR02466 family)